VLRRHFDPEQGTPYWLEVQERLGRPVAELVKGPEELHRLGPFDLAALRRRPLRDFVPRSLSSAWPDLVLTETGGTTGRPLRAVFTPEEFEEAFCAPYCAVSRAHGFPRGGRWLFLGPTGPHAIGRAALALARAHGAPEPFRVDMDPRWARAQAPGSLGARLYLEHVLAQALDLIDREHPTVLFTTPPLALALAQELALKQRDAFAGIHLGGLPVTHDALGRLREAFPKACLLPGYGNALFGLLMPVPGGGDAEALDYHPLAGRLLVSVVQADGADGRLDRPVEPGERGRVVLSRLDESFLLVNVVERDLAIRIEGGARAEALGLRSTGIRAPFPAHAGDAIGGLY